MRLKTFRVQGFKNFQSEITLHELGPINVIHGDNNVGKSNLLEAMDLFFQVLGDTRILTNRLAHTELSDYPAAALFNLEAPRPIEMSATFAVSAEACAAAGINVHEGVTTTDLTITLRAAYEAIPHWTIPVIQLFDQELQSDKPPDAPRIRQLEPIFRQLARLQLAQEQRTVSRYLLIGTDRRTRTTLPAPANKQLDKRPIQRTDSLVPDSLLLALYDAKESLEPLRYKRWELFVEVMQQFEDILGKGQLVATFDRHASKANLSLQTAHARIPIGLQGSGVQQLIMLMAHLLVSDATIVAIEEPELNLRFDLQRRLRDALQAIVASPDGPAQIFLTSHSPAFESGERFYAMRASDHGPVVERRPNAEAPLFTVHQVDTVPPSGKRAPLCYVSSEGLVQVPEDVRKRLGVEHGGGVFFVDRADTGHVEMLSNEQFLDLLEPIDTDSDD